MMRHRASSKPLALMLTLALLVAQASAVSREPELPNPGNAGISRDEQIKFGFQAAAQVYQQMPVLPDSSPETQYIRQARPATGGDHPSSNTRGHLSSTSSRRRRSMPSRSPAGRCS